MSLWEYKVITSGKGGFATPALLEKFLNDLGRDEWEIVHFQTAPENFLAFTGLARRSTQRDWTLEDAAAAAAKAEAEKLRAEFEAKFKAANQPQAAAEERASSFLEEKVAPDDGFRKPVDTSHDDEPEPVEDEKDEWDELTQEDELPTFFEAIKPHMRRNQRGPGMSVGVDYLAKKWDQTEEDLKAALLECGFVMPADEDAKPEYLEYDGDLYWLNINRRGELWINTKEKPRPVFRPVKAVRVEVEAPAPKEEKRERPERPAEAAEAPAASEERPEAGERKPEAEEKPEGETPKAEAPEGAKPEGNGKPLPEGAELLRKIRPHMRRNRRGPGGSGSTSFLSRAMRTNEADLKTAFVKLGLTVPATPGDKPVYTEIGNEVWWLNLDSRGGLWINGREKRQGEAIGVAPAEGAAEQPAPAEATPGAAAPEAVPAPEIVPAVSGAAEANAPVTPATETGGPAADASAPAPAAETGLPAEQPLETPRDASERAREAAPTPAETTPIASEAPAKAPDAATNAVLAGVRLMLRETKTGAIAAKVDRIAEELSKPADELVATLVGAGLKVPEKPREKPVFVEHAGEIFWLNKNARGELWLNAKASKFSEKPEGEEAGEPDAGAEPAGETADASETNGATAGEGGEGEEEKKPRRVRSRGRRSE